MSFAGMDVGVVYQVSAGLGVQAGNVASITSTVEGLVSQSLQLWEGADAVDFAHLWHSSHRPMLESLRQVLDEMAVTARVNAEEQDVASSDAAEGGRSSSGLGQAPRPASWAGWLDGEQVDLATFLDIIDNGWAAGLAGGLTLAAGAVSTTGALGGLGYRADASVHAGLKGAASLSAGRDGINASAGVTAGLSGTAGVRGDYGLASGGARVDGLLGAEATARGHLGLDGASGSAGAFAGGRVSGTVDGEVGGLGGRATAEAWAGAGARIDGSATFENGRLTVGGHLGAALGVGGSFGGQVTVDPEEIAQQLLSGCRSGGRLVRPVIP